MGCVTVRVTVHVQVRDRLITIFLKQKTLDVQRRSALELDWNTDRKFRSSKSSMRAIRGIIGSRMPHDVADQPDQRFDDWFTAVLPVFQQPRAVPLYARLAGKVKVALCPG